MISIGQEYKERYEDAERKIVKLQAEIDRLNGRPVEIIPCTHPEGCKSCAWCGYKAAPQLMMGHVMLALEMVRGAPTMTSNQCHAMAALLNGYLAELNR